MEDNPYNIITLKAMLRAIKLQIDHAENGKLGVDAFEKSMKKTCCKKYYKIIFMDLNMPVMDGFTST